MVRLYCGFVVEISNCDQTYGLAAPSDADGNPQAGADADKFLATLKKTLESFPDAAV